MRVKDVTVEDLERLVLLIRKTWVGEREERAKFVPCGTLIVHHVDGRAELHLHLKFPLSL